MDTLKITGQLEIDFDRGVIYFHADKTGHTVLRVCQVGRLDMACPAAWEKVSFVDIFAFSTSFDEDNSGKTAIQNIASQ